MCRQFSDLPRSLTVALAASASSAGAVFVATAAVVVDQAAGLPQTAVHIAVASRGSSSCHSLQKEMRKSYNK